MKIDAKAIEVRDEGTMISAMAFRVTTETEQERHLFARAGYGVGREEHPKYVFMLNLSKLHVEHDPHAWMYGRTMNAVHLWVQKHWNQFASGDVIDWREVSRELAEEAAR